MEAPLPRPKLPLPRRLLRAAMAVALPAFLAAAAAWWLLPPLEGARYTGLPASGEMRAADGSLLHAALNPQDQWEFPREMAAISTLMVQATLSAEDQRFHRHGGVDTVAVARALLQNLRGARVRSGASTITMQLVKMTDQLPRTLWAKGVQAVRAVRLERSIGKHEILQAYLNKAPYGLNLIGVEAASRRYFAKPASELTLAEAALLAGLPKAPTRYQPIAHPAHARDRRDYVLRRMEAEGYISRAQCGEALREPVGAAWHEFPRHAPHLAVEHAAALKQGKTVQLTLDADLQAQLEALLPEHLKRFDGEISNAAVMVVDVPRGRVLARCGSAGFFGVGGGQVDLCRARRSPGSALKPFVYALALEQNRLFSSEMLLDDTLDYGAYNPGNFDGEFNGLISATDALRHSLNVPALLALERVGAPALQHFLEEAGLTTVSRDPSQYGLGLTLGNCDVSLAELAGAYRCLANLGEFAPLQLSEDEARPVARRVLDRGVALALYRMLEAQFPQEHDPGLVEGRGVMPRVCWKTGTSTGYHDAWAFAFDQQYLVAVLMANSDGRPSRQLVGANAALPLAGKIFRMLPHDSAAAWPAGGGDLREVPVCTTSGLPAGAWCINRREELIPRVQYLNRSCAVHIPSGDGVAERWPGTPHGWDLANVRSVSETSGKPAGREVKLAILAPANRAEFVLTGAEDGDRIQLRSSVDAQATVHWYLDDKFVGSSTPGSPQYLDLQPGPHALTCMSEAGETTGVQFEVRTPETQVPFEVPS
jgi:penicillin-binding protein 1C